MGTNEEIKLLPCPFCGGTNILFEGSLIRGPVCTECGGSTETVVRWNTRHLPPLTPAMIEVLGTPNFRTGPIARDYREAGGFEIKRRVEDEQAFVLHRYLPLAINHGDQWRKHALDDLRAHALPLKPKAE